MSTPAFPGRRAFTLMEILVVVAIIGVLLALVLPAIGGARRMAGLARETSSARQIAGAYLGYAADHDGELMPGFGDFPAYDADGTKLGGPVNTRYPWRLAPYLKYEMRLFWGSDVDDRIGKLVNGPRPPYVYAVSVMPALGINAMYVGGDYQVLPPNKPRVIERYGNFCVTRLHLAENPSRQIVFASAAGENGGQRLPGYFKVEAPNTTTKVWNVGADLDSSSENYGHVDFRWGGKALAVMLDGHVEMMTPKQMDDMQLWSSQAARARQPDWRLGDPVE